MPLRRRAALASLAAVLAGCGSATGPEQSGTTTSTPDTGPETADPTGTDPTYASCDPEFAPTEPLHTAGGIPESLTESAASDYARELERDLVLPPPEERSDGHVSIGTVEVEPVEYGFLVTVPVTGGYYNEASDDDSTVHADLAHYTATYFINENVVRRTKHGDAELDPRDYGEVVVCESG